MNLKTDICGISFKNPIIPASGTYGFGREFDEFYDISCLGGIALKGLTLQPRAGNPAPRSAETAGGMLNAVGLQNPGVDAFLKNDLPWLLTKNMVIIANIAGNTLEDYVEIARRLRGTGLHMLELNISCPNVKEGGVQFGVAPKAVFEVTKAVKEVCEQPLIVKLSPNVSSIAENALAAEEAGADAISLINTITGMAIDPYKRRPIIANVTGGLSGPCVKPVALRMVYEVCKVVKVPVIGMGGIMTGLDVVEFLLCGASAVMVGTANLADPMASLNILEELKAYMVKEKIDNINKLIGALRLD